jgi:hypothetical protein
MIVAFSANCKCQTNRDSIVGKYVNHSEIGGGFTGGPNGECMVLPPDYIITNTLLIDSNLVVSKISDTTGFKGIFISLACDTLYIGKAEFISDTIIIVTYTLKPLCSILYSTNGTLLTQQYEKLSKSIVEKYTVMMHEGHVIGLTNFDSYFEEFIRRE